MITSAGTTEERSWVDYPPGQAPKDNEDWLATCTIYGDWTETHPVDRGFLGSVRITMSTGYTAFFRSIEDKKGQFRYFQLSQQPQLLLQFHYAYDIDANDSDQCGWLPPTLFSIQWTYYPKEWPDQHKIPLLSTMQTESNRLLEEEQLSFGVCEYCEHYAIHQYKAWHVFHHEDPFRLIRLPPITDSLYHTNHGKLIHVQQEARKLPASSNRSNKSTSKQQQQQQQVLMDAKMLVNRPRPATVEDYARQALLDEWKQLYSTSCPICFDTMSYSEGITLPCHHFVCEDCLTSLLHFKVKELNAYRTNPFACPVETCRHALPIIGFVKQYLPPDEMDEVRKWIKDMKYPPCFSLDRCLSKVCGAMESMRRVMKDSTNIFCDQCHKHWCELCLKRLNEDGTEKMGLSHKNRCEDTVAWKFCKRYMAASDDQKQACEAKWPWIVSYAHSRQHDGDALTWILQNGQVCPNCANGVERIAGCFHMKCPTCATHFCYECGDELFPPYYGTHHCWEQSQLQL